MDYNVEEVDDIDVIVEDTNVQMELENKLVSDLMKSLEYEHQQEGNEELLQDGKEEAKNVPNYGQEHANFCDLSKSCGRDLGGSEYHGIPLIVIETEDEWRRRECNEKTLEPRDKTSPGETTLQGKQNLKQEDLEFEINMEQFQKELSDVVKDDSNTQAKNKDIFSSILEELQSNMEEAAFVSLSEGNTEEGEREFNTVLRAGDEGQRCSTKSEMEIRCMTSQGYVLDMPYNMSVDVQEFGLDYSESLPTIKKNSVPDSPMLIDSTKRFELVNDDEEQSQKSTSKTLGDAELIPENLSKHESANLKDLVNQTTQLSNKPECFEETKNTTLDPQGQDAEISSISGDFFEIKNADDVTPCGTQEGGSIYELPHTPNCDFEKTNITFQEHDMENAVLLTGSLSGIVSRNDIDHEFGVDLQTDQEGSLEEGFKLPVVISNEGDDRTRSDLVSDLKILAAGVDDDKSGDRMARKVELYENSICTARQKTMEIETTKVVQNDDIEWDDRSEMKEHVEVVTDSFKLEEKNLISFDDDDDNDVLVAAHGLPLAIGTPVSEKEENGPNMGHSIDLLTENRVEDSENGGDVRSKKIKTNFVLEKDILLEENESGWNSQVNEMENGKREDEIEVKRYLSSVPVIGTLVEISPQRRDKQVSPETAGIPPGPFENTDVIINSCKDQILCETSTCRNMYASEQEITNITSKVDNVGDEQRTKGRKEEESMKEKEKVKSNNAVLSCGEDAKNTCGLMADAGNDSKAQSHEIQTMDENNYYQKDEEVVGKKIESNICSSTKRQREQDTDIEVGLKKLKINDTLEERRSTNEQHDIGDSQESQNSSFRYDKEEKRQGIEIVECEKNVQMVEKECYYSSEENVPSQETCLAEKVLFSSQELDSQDEQDKRNVLVKLEENYELECVDGTSECGSGIETSVVEIVPVMPDKWNDELVACDSKNEDVEIQHSLPCCYGDATSTENKVNENIPEEYDLEKLVLDEETEAGNVGKVEKDETNFQEEIKQFELKVGEDWTVTKRADGTCAVGEDSVAVLSERLNELLIDKEEKQTDTENTLGEEPLVKIATDSRCYDEVTQDEGTRITQGIGQEKEVHSECLAIGQEVDGGVTQGESDLKQDAVVKATQGIGKEDQIHSEDQAKETKEGDATQEEESVTQGEPDLKQDAAVKVTQSIGQEDQIHSEGQTKETEEGDATQEEKSVTQDLDKDVTRVTQDTEKKLELEDCVTQGLEKRVAQEVKDVGQEIGEEAVQKVLKENELNKDRDITQETEERVTQQAKKEARQDASRVETSNQVVTQVEQSVMQGVTRETASSKDVALEIEKRIAEQVLRDEKHIEEEMLEEKQKEKTKGQVTQREDLAQHVKQEVTQEYKDDTKELKIEKEITQEEKRVTLLEENVTDDVEGATGDVNAIQQLIREVMQSEIEACVTQEAEKNAKEEVDGVIKQTQKEKDRKQEEEEKKVTMREGFEEKTLEVTRQERGCEPLERRNETVNQFSTDKQQEEELKDYKKIARDSGISVNSQGNWIEGIEPKDKSCETVRKCENENENKMACSQETEEDEDKQNRIRSFEMLVHLETIIKELEMYRSEQNKLRESFKTCMNEVMINLSSMTKAVQVMETRLNQKIKDAHEELKKCYENLEGNRATVLSMDTLLRSYTATQNQFGDLRQRVKDLEIICTALNVTEMQDKLSNQVSAEIDTMDKRVRFTENDISDLKLRVTELEAECSSLRKLSPSEKQQEIQVWKKELKFGRVNSRIKNSQGRMRGDLNEEASLSRSSPVIGPGQRYCGLYSEEV